MIKQMIIDGHQIDMASTEIVSANILGVACGSNGFQGGDSGHGCRTVFALSDESSTDIRVRVTSNGEEKEYDHADEFEIILGGDCELETFLAALKFGLENIPTKDSIIPQKVSIASYATDNELLVELAKRGYSGNWVKKGTFPVEEHGMITSKDYKGIVLP